MAVPVNELSWDVGGSPTYDFTLEPGKTYVLGMEGRAAGTLTLSALVKSKDDAGDYVTVGTALSADGFMEFTAWRNMRLVGAGLSAGTNAEIIPKFRSQG